MKKLLLLTLMFLFVVSFVTFAKVTITEKDGKYFATLTYNSDLPQANIIGSFQNWVKPGIPMTKNADGVWEITIPIDAPMFKYKFYDPAKSDDSAYLDDTENPDKIANPFGSFDYLVRRPKKGSGGAGAEDDFNPTFGMWARMYYNLNWVTDLSQKIVYDKDGKAVYTGFASGERKTDSTAAYKDDYQKEYDNGSGTAVKRPVVDKEVGFSWSPWQWYGENGTTAGDYSRLVFGRDSFHSNNTLKFHGKVLKHFQVDVEINAQLFFCNSWTHLWQGHNNAVGGLTSWGGTAYGAMTDAERKAVKDAREYSWNTIARDSVSNFFSSLFGGLGRDYVFAKQYFNNGSATLGQPTNQNYDSGSMHVDQVRFSWTTKDFDINIAPAGGKGIISKDPMQLISGDRTGSTNYTQSNIQFLIHPTAVKGLNINLGTTYSGNTNSYAGNGAKFASTSTVGRFLAYGDLYYDILGLGKYTIGAIYTMSSYAPGSTTYELNFFKVYKGLDAFANAIHQMSLWGNLTPVSGLSIQFQGTMELPTKYFDTVDYLDGNTSWTNDKASKKGYDFLAHAADYIKIGYKNNMIDVAVWQAAAGTRFEGDLSATGSMFANYLNVWSDDATDHGLNGHGDVLGKVKVGLDFSIKPMSNELLKIGYSHILSMGAKDVIYGDYSFAFATQQYKSDRGDLASKVSDSTKTIYMINYFIPSISSKFKAGSMDMEIGVLARIKMETLVGETLVDNDLKQISTTTAVLDKASLDIKLDNVSDGLKSVWIEYQFRMANYDSPLATLLASDGTSTTQKNIDNVANKAAWGKFVNQIMVEMKLKNDIFIGAGYILRFYHGRPSPNATYTAVLSDDAAYKTAYYAIPDYWNWGLALQFKYIIPVKVLKTPTFFANLGLGWEPFHELDPGFLQTDSLQHGRYEWGQADDWNQAKTDFQFSNLTIGLKWDF